MIPYKGVTLNPISQPIWIVMEKSFVKWPTGTSLAHQDHVVSAYILDIIKNISKEIR